MNIEDIKTEEKNVEMPEKKDKKKKEKNKHEEEILKLTEELAQEKEKSMRIQAEMMNFRKRKEDEVSNLYKYANEDILKKLVNILDNFERALSLKNEENKDFLEGFQMIYTNILNILTDNEVVEIECLNEPFDPAFHQAVLTETKDGVDSGIVIEVLQKGYMYKDRVLRTAMVKVSE
ncbi:MAG: nucleotide exchange factor GrpE [Erysipelotrichales bacterium]|nr:nucleotide exchange factor GrpE [Erysipelotrichales bacterium]